MLPKWFCRMIGLRVDVGCSYCGRRYSELGLLMEGAAGVFICQDCAKKCAATLDEEAERRAKAETDFLEEPRQKLQFSVRGLLSVFTIAAIVLGILGSLSWLTK